MDNNLQSPSLQEIVIPERGLLLHQREVLLQDNHRFKVLVWHRRARKTSTAINELVKQAHLKKGVYWHIFPTYSAAKEAVWKDPMMLFRIIPKEIIEKTNEQELTIYLKCGSIISLKGADNPQRLRGAGPLGVVLDEFDEMKIETWGEIVEPILRANGGWAWFIGTPRGKRHLHKFYMRGQNADFPEWKSWLLKASTSGVIPARELKNSRATMSQAHYNQEWECDFLEGEGKVFRGVRAVMTAQPRKPNKDSIYIIGADLGKTIDYTVLTVYDRKTLTQVYQDRFKDLEWPYQKRKIREISKHFNNALVYLDATGLGDPIADYLIRAKVPVEPIKITAPLKKEMVEKLAIWIEQGLIKMIPTEQSLIEFDNFSYEIGKTGRITYCAPEGEHDDIVIAQALAIWGLQPPVTKVREKKPSLVKQKYLTDINKLNKKDYEEDITKEWDNSWSEF